MNAEPDPPEPQPTPNASSEPWRITSLRENLAGEQSANFVRLIGLGLFFGIEVLRYHVLEPGIDARFHELVTAIVVAWVGLALATQLALVRRYHPSALKFTTTLGDLVLVTLLLLAGDGPQSALVVVYFPLLGLAALRFHLALVRFATAGACLSYLVVLGNAYWARPELRVPRPQELIVGAALLTTGVVLGQLVRRARAVALDFVERRRRLEEGGE